LLRLTEKVELLESNQRSLRGLVNRKLSDEPKEEEKDSMNSQFPKTKDLKPFSPFN